MGKNLNRRFTISLDIDSKSVEKQVKSTVGNLKNILADLGNASDKMNYFKELIDYMQQVDSAVDAWRKNNAFGNMFDGLDENLRKEMETVFGVAKEELTKLSTLKDKVLHAKTGNATTDELRAIEKEIKELYGLMGKQEDAKITGRGTFETRISRMEDALNNFASVWNDVNNKISKGFGFGGGSFDSNFGGGSGGGKGDPVTSSVQGIIDKLNRQNEELKAAKSRLMATTKDFKDYMDPNTVTVVSDKYKTELTEESLRGLMSEYDALEMSLKSTDATSADYYNTLEKLISVSMRLKRAMQDIRSDESLRDVFSEIPGGEGTGNSTFLGVLSKYADNKNPISKDVHATIKANLIDKTIQNNSVLIGELNTSNDVNSSIQKRVDLYEELKSKAIEYQKILLTDYETEKEEDAALDKQEKIEKSIQKLTGAKGARGLESIQLVLEELAEDGKTVDSVLQKLYQTLGMELPDDFKTRIESLAAQVEVIEGASKGGSGSGSGTGGNIASSIERAKESLREFLTLTNEIQNKSFSLIDASGNVEIGKYTERLEAAKNALREFGDEGILTAQDMEKVEAAFQEAQSRLSMYTTSYNSHGGHSYTYYDEYQDAREEAHTLAEENERLKQDVENLKQKADSSDDKIARKNALLKDLDNMYESDEWYPQEQLEGILQERNAILQSLKQEGLLTDDIIAKHEAINAEISERIKFAEAKDKAEETLNNMDDLTDAADMDDLDSVMSLLKTRKEMLDSISPLALEEDVYADNVEEAKEYNTVLERRIELLKQVKQGLIEIDDVDNILNETGSLDNKIERLQDFIYTSGLTEKPSKDDDISEELEEFESVYDRITLKLANGRKIDILPDLKGLNALAKFYDSDDGTYGPTEIDDIIFVRKQEQAVVQQTNQELEEQLNLQNQINKVETQDVSVDETSEYKSEADAIEYRNEALKEGNALKAQEDDLNRQNVSGTGTLVDTDVYKGDINAEIQQLENLKAILLEVEQAVQAKTQAFRDEGIAVEQTVSREIEALRELLLALGYIKSAADTINDAFTQKSNILALPSSSNNVITGGYALESTLQTTNGILKTISEKLSGNEALTGLVEPLNNAVAELKNAAHSVAEHRKQTQQSGGDSSSKSKNNLSQQLSAQKSVFTAYRNELADVDYLTDDVRKKLDHLAISLKSIDSKADLDKWKESFSDVREEVSVLQSAFEKLGAGNVRKITGVLNNELKGLDFSATSSNITAEQQEILELREKLIQQLTEYSAAVKNGKQVELNSINDTVNALKEKVNAYKTANDFVNAGGKSGKTFGATATINATAKFNSLKQQATGVGSEFANSEVVKQAFKDYEAAYDRLIAKRKELAQLDNLNDSQIAGFKQLQTECNNYAKALNKIITDSQKLNANAANDQPWMLGGDFDDTAESRKAALTDFVQEMYGVSVAAENFKNNWNEVVFAVNNGDGTFTQMSATFNAAKTQIVALTGDTKKATSAFEAFFNELKGKFRSVASYAMASISIYDFIRVIKQGVTYVKEIDSALTELKKVTDETDASYAKFLQDMSKTGSVIGATVKDLTTMAADWARLGSIIKSAPLYSNI